MLTLAFAVAGLASLPPGMGVLADGSFTDLPGWHLVFSDEFTTPIARGSFVSSTAGRYFVYPNTWKDTSKNGTYSPEIIAVQDGLLDIAIATVSGVHKVAALSPISSEGSLAGMRVAFRIRSDRMVGYKGVPLLWPDSNVWPRDGEIDFPESNFDGQPMAFMHRQDAITGSDQDWYSTPTGTSWQDWHDYVMEWVPGVRCDFYLDGVQIGHSTARVPNTPMHLTMQFETQLSGGPPADSVSGHVQIDRIGMWAIGSSTATPTAPVTPSPSSAAGPVATPSPSQTAGTSAPPSGPASPSATAAPSSAPSQRPVAVATTIQYGDSSRAITYSAGWATARHRLYLGGAVHYSNRANVTATLRFTGSAVTWLGPKGPTRGRAYVYVDGRLERSVSMYSSAFLARPQPLFTRTWTRVGSHLLTIRVARTLDHRVVAIDAFAVRR